MSSDDYIEPYDGFFEDFRKKSRQLQKINPLVRGHVMTALNSANVDFMDVPYRIKDQFSAAEKCAKKTALLEKRGEEGVYTLNDMHDILGLRVVVYIESTIERVKEILHLAFDVDDLNSVDKRSILSVDKVGYRSLQVVASLGKNPKGEAISDELRSLPFEIQIRTVFEHCWAQIEHKLNYKSVNSLPNDLMRRLNILSGTLELADRELSSIVESADNYAKKVSSGSSDTDNDPITIASLKALVVRHARDVRKEKSLIFIQGQLRRAIDELEEFGVENNHELEVLLKIIKDKKARVFSRTVMSFVRLAMMLSNIEKYFKHVYKGKFSLSEKAVNELVRVSRDADLRSKLQEWGVKLV